MGGLWSEYEVRGSVLSNICKKYLFSVSIDLCNEHPNEGNTCKFKRTILLVVINVKFN